MDFKFFEEKIIESYLLAVLTASLPWQAFLVPSVPYNALRLSGAYYLALRELVGPINFLHLLTASGDMSYIPTAKSEVINYIRLG